MKGMRLQIVHLYINTVITGNIQRVMTWQERSLGANWTKLDKFIMMRKLSFVFATGEPNDVKIRKVKSCVQWFLSSKVPVADSQESLVETKRIWNYNFSQYCQTIILRLKLQVSRLRRVVISFEMLCPTFMFYVSSCHLLLEYTEWMIPLAPASSDIYRASNCVLDSLWPTALLSFFSASACSLTQVSPKAFAKWSSTENIRII